MSFKDYFATVAHGVKSMVMALIILTLAWTISGVCRELLQTGPFVAHVVSSSQFPVAFIPCIMFVVAAGISFATGTSWGTFGILIPITIDICMGHAATANLPAAVGVAPWLNIITLSAVMAGSVFGDHCSPISDTTILSSTGAHCRHIDHVSTQLPYALTVASVCFVGYIVAGFIADTNQAAPLAPTTLTTLPVVIVILAVLLIVLPRVSGENAKLRASKYSGK
jgi:Na+/H+ antiporter NhaC